MRGCHEAVLERNWKPMKWANDIPGSLDMLVEEFCAFDGLLKEDFREAVGLP